MSIVVGVVNLGSALLDSGGCGSLSSLKLVLLRWPCFSGCVSGQCSEGSQYFQQAQRYVAVGG